MMNRNDIQVRSTTRQKLPAFQDFKRHMICYKSCYLSFENGDALMGLRLKSFEPEPPPTPNAG
ncbi:hypothetical protein CCR95_12335 [Thiocystis minor]|nr:hypothetical protein [Thiocystis minor]